MVLKTKKWSLRKPLFLLMAVSAFALSTVVGHCADDRLDQPGYVSPHLEGLSPKQHALIKAVKDGDLLNVKLLINREKIDKNTQDLEDSNSLLHLAIKKQKNDIFEFFLRVNCDVNIQNDYGETPLHEVASIGNKEMLDALLEEDTARVNTQDKDGNTAFHVAILKKKLECVSSFMNAKGFDYTLKNRKGLTVGDLFDQQAQNAQGHVVLARELKTRLVRDFNVTVLGIQQKEVPVTSSVQNLVTSVIQQDRKLFLSYCWSKEYSTKPMVDDFERFIKKLGITNYYRDVREEEGLGMTLGTNIEEFMRHAKDSDAVIIFLNDAYLRSRNCMYEFLQVWDADTQKVSPNGFILRHPDFCGLFGGPNAAVPYLEHWDGVFKSLRSKEIAAADMRRHNEEERFVINVRSWMASIISELSGHIQADYQQQRLKGFENVFKAALARGSRNQLAAADVAQTPSPSSVKAGEDEQKSPEREQETAVARRATVAEEYYNTALLYQNGIGTPKDYEKAREWFDKAAAQGNAAAQCSLGYLYYNGQGVRQDYEKARGWFEKAAAQGNADAQYRLGSIYHDGLGIAKDDEKAWEWFEKAAVQGNADAQHSIRELHEAEVKRLQERITRLEQAEGSRQQGVGESREAEEARQELERLKVQLAEAGKREEERIRKLEQEAAQRTEGIDKRRTKELQEAEAKHKKAAEEAKKRIEDLEKQLVASKQKEDERIRKLEQEAAQRAEGIDKQRTKELQEAEAKRKAAAEEGKKRIENLEKQLGEARKGEDDHRQKLAQEAAGKAQLSEGADKRHTRELQERREAEEASRKKIEDLEKQLAASKQKEDEQFVQKAAEVRRDAPEEKDPAERGPAVPPIAGPAIPLAAKGHEAVYLRFLNGALIYKPNKNGVGMVTLPIAKLANPLEGTFDLSTCGDTGKYLRIATGYRKDVKNDSKVEIWFTPRFLVESNLKASACHFQPIFGKWDARNAVGIFWSWSNDALKHFDYLTTQTMDQIGSENLYEKWVVCYHLDARRVSGRLQPFHVSFVN
jgi:TPR repeat protein/ankyrin repeat protein